MRDYTYLALNVSMNWALCTTGNTGWTYVKYRLRSRSCSSKDGSSTSTSSSRRKYLEQLRAWGHTRAIGSLLFTQLVLWIPGEFSELTIYRLRYGRLFGRSCLKDGVHSIFHDNESKEMLGHLSNNNTFHLYLAVFIQWQLTNSFSNIRWASVIIRICIR